MKRLRDLTYLELLERARPYLLRHPGHQPQSVHAGGKHRLALANAGTIDEINDVAMSEALRITGRKIYFHLGNSDADPGLARDHAEGVLQGLERFPKAKLWGVDVFNPNSTYYADSADAFAITVRSENFSRQVGSRILFNADWVNDPAKYHRALSNSSRGHLSVPTAQGIALHEFGHVIGRDTQAATAARVIASQKAQKDGTKPSTYVGGNLSRYAMTNPHELLAEAFADSMTRGHGAEALSQAIFSEIEKRYKR